jgi:hypothetical protein
VEPSKQVPCARQGPSGGKQLEVELAVTPLQTLLLFQGQRPADLARDRTGEEPAAHADTTVDAPAVDANAGFVERLLPCHHVGVHGVDQGAVEVEDEGAHRHQSVTSADERVMR